MSEAGSETLEDEWQSISEIASTCNTILESLSREGEATGALGVGPRIGWGSFSFYLPAPMIFVSPQDSPSRRMETPRELQSLMLSKPPCADLAPHCARVVAARARTRELSIVPGRALLSPTRKSVNTGAGPVSFKWVWEPAGRVRPTWSPDLTPLSSGQNRGACPRRSVTWSPCSGSCRRTCRR